MRAAAATAVVFALGAFTVARANGIVAPGRNPTQAENALTGSSGWESGGYVGRAIEGYASQIGIAPGEAVQFHVSTEPAAPYRIEVYRLGWYGGTGGRLVACLPSCAGARTGFAQAHPPAPPTQPGLHDPPLRARWLVTDTLQSSADWTSGYYVVRFLLTGGPDAGKAANSFFVVRQAQRAAASQIVVQVPVNTWEAYNQWGGKSLYDFDGPRAHRVSFDRPFGQYAQSPFWWEIQLVRYLEREGYDVSYQTDLDTHLDPGSLQRHRLVLTAGHGEYWTKEIRDGFDGALAAGTNIAFMGSNTGYWQVRYEDDGRTIVAYKNRSDPEPDPALKTVMFRQLDQTRPECLIEGVQHRWLRPHPLGPTDYVVTDQGAADPWLRETGLGAGSVLRGVVGDEWDGLNPWPDACRKPGLVVLFHHGESSPDGDADAVRWTAPSGARVFASGAQRFSWGLDALWTQPYGHPGADPALQHFTRNMLDDLTRPPPPNVAVTQFGRSAQIDAVRPVDPRLRGFVLFRKPLGQPPVRVGRFTQTIVDTPPAPGAYRYLVVAVDHWGGRSQPTRTDRLSFG